MRPPRAPITAVLVAVAAIGAGCAPIDPPVTGSAFPAATPGSPAPRALRYVALGDSYTIGTSVEEAGRWPNQLVARLAASPPARALELRANLGVNGYTSEDVARLELPQLEDDLPPEFVSLLVGVNDVVRGVPVERYRERVEGILDRLLERLSPNRIVCVETPDYTVTPQGAAYGDPQAQRAGIRRVNAVLQAACEARAIRFVGGIFDISSAAAMDRYLVADDGLHPSAPQYRRWVEEQIEPAVRELLDQP